MPNRRVRMDRQSTLELLKDYVKTDSLMKHLVAVEAAMRAYARKFGEDEERWGIAGLLHDFDWEIVPTPEEHPTYGAGILRKRGYPEEIVRAVLTHGDHTGLQRESLMEHTLFAVDELTGFVRAVTLVRPNRSLDEVTPGSVRRKMKDKAFARDVNREDITRGAQELGIDLEEHMTFVIDSLKPVATELGLNTGLPGAPARDSPG
jgi:putative nucleotidyltransferase with HDIG domain